MSAERAPAGCCVFCGKAIDPQYDYRRVRGFERRRGGGGTNALRLREPLPEWACRWCVERASKGIAPQQGTLGP